MALPKSLRDTATLLRNLPQIGPRQASRLALHLYRNRKLREELAAQLKRMEEGTVLCERCFRISETTPCAICRDRGREAAILAVVEEDTDLEKIEESGAFRGRYFVLGGRFNPNRGSAAEQGLRVSELMSRIAAERESLREVILAMNPTVEGDMLALALMRELRETGVRLSRLGRGLPVGGEIEYADEETLRGALEHRS